MNIDYITQRVKYIIASYAGVEPEDVESEMSLSEFNLDDLDVIFLLDKIEEEFECELPAREISSDSIVLQIITLLM